MKGIKLTALLCSSAMAYAPAAWAQQAPPAAPSAPTPQQSAEELQDIVVTAQKRSERLNDVPISITAADGDTLRDRGITSVGDLEKLVPGFIFASSAYGSPIYNIRGVGFYDDAMAISPAVSVYVDQVPMPFPRMTQGATLDVERVEVLKGPQGTLFGQNSTGGAVNYIAAKPTDVLHWGGSLGFGRFAAADAEAYISGPISDTLKARIAVRSEQRGDWQISNSRPNQTLGQRDYLTGRMLLDWAPSDSLRFEVNLNGWRDRSDTQAMQYQRYEPNQPGGLQTGIGFPNFQADLQATPRSPDNARAADWDPQPGKYTPEGLRRNDRFYQASLRGDLDLSDSVTLTSISAYSNLKVLSPSDSDGTPLPNNLAILHGKLESFNQEVRLAGTSMESKLKWMVGGNYQHDNTIDKQLVYFNATNTSVGDNVFDYIGFDNDQRINTLSGFGSLDYSITSKLTFQASARYQHQKRHFDGCLFDPGTDGLFGVAFGALSNALSGQNNPFPFGTCVTMDPTTHIPGRILDNRTDNNVSWRANLSWKPSSDVLLYANVTRGYKAASYGTLPFLSPIQGTPVPPERLTAYEAGFKATLLNRTLQLTAAGFYYDYGNKQLRGYLNAGAPFGNVTALVSIPQSRIIGAEVSANWMPVHGLTINVGGTYIDSKVTGPTTTNPTPIGKTIVINGMAFPNTPKWQITSDAEYKFGTFRDVDMFVGGSASYRSVTTSFFQDTNDFTLPGYTLLDVRAGFERSDGKWRLEFWGRNVTNKYYWVHAEKITDTIARMAGMPATYGARLTVRY